MKHITTNNYWLARNLFVAWVACSGALWAHAAPTVNGLFYGDGDEHAYVLYNTSIGGSKLWYTVSGNRLYVALVVSRDVNDNVFGNRDYTRNAGWSPPHAANRLVDSEFARFTLTVGGTTYEWNQGYGALVGGVWKSDHTTGAGSGTPPPGYQSSSSFAWNINNYVTNPAPNWDLYANGTDINNWKSPFNPSAPNTVLGLDGYPATGPIRFSTLYQWEWPMVYEWSVDLSSFGTAPIFVISGQSHHSPAKTGSEDDPFPTPPGNGYLTDYGDLPAPYPTLLAQNGARHYLVPNGAVLGSLADPEPDGLPHPLARGDDLSASDDEDGIALLSPLIPGGSAVLQVTAATAGNLSAFIDWDGDGTLDSVTLLSATGPTSLAPGVIGDLRLAAGVYELTIQVPAYAAGSLPARFRFTNAAGQGGNSPAGLVTTGEVEDYIWTATIGDRVWEDANRNGIQDTGESGLAGMTVTLYDSASNPLAVTQSGVDGVYAFSNLLSATYLVGITSPGGYVVTTAFAGSDTGLDSNAGPTGLSEPVWVAAGQHRTDIDFGVRGPTPLSAALDIGLYATASGVTLELWTTDEEGVGDVVVYAWIDVEWIEVARVPAGELVGWGSNRYEVPTAHLEPGTSYDLIVIDEVGNVHFSAEPVAVRTLRMNVLRLERETLTLAFSTEPGRRYVIEGSTDLRNWARAPVSHLTADGWSGSVATPFSAWSVRSEVRVPTKGRPKAYFRAKLVE